MTPDRATSLFFELFSGLPRQGPGSTASTRRALGLVPGVRPRTRVLDIGCGTGAQTLVLADSSPSRIVAVDNHPPFIDVLNHEARRLGITDRLEARVADMRRLDFADGSLDLRLIARGREQGVTDEKAAHAPPTVGAGHAPEHRYPERSPSVVRHSTSVSSVERDTPPRDPSPSWQATNPAAVGDRPREIGPSGRPDGEA